MIDELTKKIEGNPDAPKVEYKITNRELSPNEIADAKTLYMEGHGTYLIVQTMHKAGWKRFISSELVGNRRLRMIGLAEGLGWRAERKAEELARRAEETIQDETAAAEPLENFEGNETEKQSFSSNRAAEPQVRSTTPSAEAAATPPNQGGEFIETSFPDWLERQEPKWFWNWRYQRFIYKRLEKIANGKSKRLMIFLPPRHGKSELVTVRFAAWILCKRPETKIIIGSYNQKLANRFSRKVRRIYFQNRQENEAHEAMPLGGVLNTADDWETPEGGGVKGVGVGAGVTGFGADLIIIDDPIKSRADANSENNRERVWEWFNDDLHTRLEPGGAIILIQTRWHEDDLAGRLLQEATDGGEQWEIVRLPALAEGEELRIAECGLRNEEDVPANEREKTRIKENPQFEICIPKLADPIGRRPGEALCPKRFSREALLEKKRKMGSASFEALYQQNPVPAGGGIFKRDWFKKIVERAPAGLKWYRGYDTAISTKTTADYTASFRCALDAEGNLYIADGFRMRIEYPDQRRFIIERMEVERDTEHGIEETLHGKAIVQDLRRERSLARSVFRGVKVTADKVTRASAWAARAEEGKVILVQGAWIREFVDEVCSFPNGRYDDQVDAVSVAVQMVEKRKFRSAGF